MSFATMFCHFYNYLSSFSMYYFSCDHGVLNFQLLSFPSFHVDYFLGVSICVKLIAKVVITWVPLCGVPMPLKYIKVFQVYYEYINIVCVCVLDK